jgi:hypothetical protein
VSTHFLKSTEATYKFRLFFLDIRSIIDFDINVLSFVKYSALKPDWFSEIKHFFKEIETVHKNAAIYFAYDIL